MAKKGLLKRIYTVQNLLTSVKALVLSFIFMAVYFIYLLLAAVIGTIGDIGSMIATILILLFTVSALFIYGYLASTLWNWK